MFRLLYPERRIVSPETIMTWYIDAIANGQIEDLGATSAFLVAQALHEAGLITLAKTR